MSDDNNDASPVELATELTIAWLSNPNTRAAADDGPAFLGKMHEAVSALGNPSPDETPEPAAPEFTPATTVRRSLASPDHIISMIDGKPYKMLRRHLGTHGLTPEQYRERYKLKADYPMVAQSYSEARRSMAKTIGLGQMGRAAKKATTPAAKVPQKRGRKPKVAADPS